jgi:hypothetical protein
MRRGLAQLVAVALLSSGAISIGQEERSRLLINFPVVFTTADEMRQFGLAIINEWQYHPRLDHQCYWYNDLLSVSHERLLRYRDMGFTLNSLCLGLISETLFNPETGQRLPTYVALNQQLYDDRRRQYPKVTPESFMSLEHPIELPKCFSRALPYIDCVFNFDRLTGRPLPRARTEEIKRLGEAVNRVMQEAIERRLLCSWPFCRERWAIDPPDGDNRVLGTLDSEHACFELGYLPRFFETSLKPKRINVPAEKQLWELGLTCFDVSINLPAGFGYTTDADGVRGPSISPDLIKMVTEPQRRLGQIDVRALEAQIKSALGPPQAKDIKQAR